MESFEMISTTSVLKPGHVMATMELITGSNEDNFLVRFAQRRKPTLHSTDLLVGTMPRLVFDLIDGAELDELICMHFDCSNEESTFRGHLRQAVDRVKPDVLTTLCAYRIGFSNDNTEETEVTLLVTVKPGSTTREEAVRIIWELRGTMESYDERLANLAVEIAELEVLLASNNKTTCPPHTDIKTMSYSLPPSVGSSIGVSDKKDSTGTMGAVLRMSTSDGLSQYLAMTCSHVLAFGTKSPLVGYGATGVKTVCPSERDNFHWYTQAKYILDCSPASSSPLAQEAKADRERCTLPRATGTLCATSGIRTIAADHWIMDCALVKFDKADFTSFNGSCNIPSPESIYKFQYTNSVEFSAKDWKEMDWERQPARYLTIDNTAVNERTAREGTGPCVFKIGRTTGHTVGRLYRIDPCVNVSYELDGKEIVIKGKALSVCNTSSSSPFAGCGDSGALVVDGHGNGVGMIIAMGNGAVINAITFISPIGPVISHMKDVLKRANASKEVELEFL